MEEESLSPPLPNPLISQRIVSVDFYSNPPNYLFDQVKNDFNRSELHWVPVIRIFGATTGGQKTCAHVHGVFPYLYIRAEGVANEFELAQRLDDALNQTSVIKSKASIKHVVQITPVKGRSFYGYHDSEELFLKIFFYTPFALTKAAQLLASGKILARQFQPFESHIPYVLQFFIDYNLFGMNLVHYKKVLFRRNECHKELPHSFTAMEPRRKWIPEEMGAQCFQSESVKRMTKCELEFDVLAEDILNRLQTRSRTSNPGISSIWEDEKERRRQNGLVDWANIPIPSSQDRAYCGDIFEAELAYRKSLLKKLEPFNYLAKLSKNGSQDQDMSMMEVDHPSSSQHNSFLPQPEFDVSFSAKNMSQVSDDDEDQSIVNFLKDMADNCPRDEDDGDYSILKPEEATAHGSELQDPSDEHENEVWSQSFMSTTLEDLEIIDIPLPPTISGAARTDPVLLRPRKERDARREWNNALLESFMIAMVVKSEENPQLVVIEPESEVEMNQEVEHPDPTTIETSPCPPPGSKTKKLTQAERLFPNAILKKENFIPPEPVQESFGSVDQFPHALDVIMTDSQEEVKDEIIKEVPSSSKELEEPQRSSDPYFTRNKIFANLLPSKTQASIGSPVSIAIQAGPETADFECQSCPPTLQAETQTKDLPGGISISTNTDVVPVSNQESQTDAGTLDVVRTCGCRCNCGLQYMTALRASWEMAVKNKDVGIQTEDSQVATPRRRMDSSLTKRRIDSASPQRRKVSRVSLDSHPEQLDQHGLSIKNIKFPELTSPVSRHKGGGENRSPRHLPRFPSAKNFDQRFHRDTGGLVDPSSRNAIELHQQKQGKRNNWEFNISNPGKFSPQFDAVTKWLKKQGHQQEHISNKLNDGDMSPPPSPPPPVSQRNLDLSITSVYEYESPDTTDQKFQRIKAAKQGLRLFEFKHRQMVTNQRGSAQRRKERKDLKDSIVEAKYTIREIIRPFKRTPQESFILDLVEQDEPKALPDAPDYYASDEPGEGAKLEVSKKPTVCVFQGGNLSDDEEASQSMSQAAANSPLCSRNSSNIARPFGASDSPHNSQNSNIDSPRSILKSKNKVKASPFQKGKSIRFGIQKPEEVEKWREEQGIGSNSNSGSGAANVTQNSVYNPNISGLDGPSPLNPFKAFNVSNLQTVKALRDHQYMTTMVIEVFCHKAQGRSEEEAGFGTGKRWEDNTLPDPMKDEVIAIFYSVHQDDPEDSGFRLGMLAVDPLSCEYEPLPYPGWPALKRTYYADEVSMFNGFLKLVGGLDPDILAGYEIKNMSWGYVIERGCVLGLKILNSLSRLVPREKKNGKPEDPADWNETINGRIVLNLWRLLRHEMTVQSYTFESAMFNILHEKVGLVSVLTLNKFWTSAIDRYRTVEFYCRRVQGVLEIIDKLDLINRTSELARLFGIQFFEVFSRGSQFRVESMMLRLVKPDNMIAASPTIAQRAQMRAPVELPLIMEPYSKYYKDPVAVLDFQSLYPSIIIAYNYDYSTCLGRVEHLGREGKFGFGCLDMEVSPVELNRMIADNQVHISPTGVAFVKSSVKRGILPEMLEQILETRLMVKRAMKTYGNGNKTLHKVLDSRQLGLKLIANVTYGYTSANFSGRMPCIEIADSVVSKGRETLERAIKLVEENVERWGAKVIYGDTDSLFLLFPNTPREVAFQLAQNIADEVTQLNPKPVKLKFEKIYQPCILQTKKRYVGFSYESPDQKEPKYDAKGIETVRRDGCPAIAKILEKSLRILFTTDDPNRLRQYLETQFQKILMGNVNLSDYTFAREYRGVSGYRTGAVVPALSIAERLRNEDRRAEPQPKERVPYVVIYGEPNQTLISQTRTPREFVENDGYRINSAYYIERAIIPALNRCFSLAGLDVQKWYAEIPRKHLRMLPHENPQYGRRIMDYFVVSKNCAACDCKTDTLLCLNCQNNSTAFIKLQNEVDFLTKKIYQISETCEYCCLGVCVSLDCPTWQKLLRYDRILQPRIEVLRRIMDAFQNWR